MAITLTSLPIENLYQICTYLSTHADVSHFRLVCRVFGAVGLDSLAPRVSFVLLPESLARLGDIASHPILRHHVYTVVCLTDVLPRYSTFEDWRQYARRPGLQLDWPVQPGDIWASEADIAANARHQISESELEEGWTTYRSVLAGQERVLKSLEHSQEVKDAFQRFTNLRHLEIISCEMERQIGTVQTFKGLFDKCLIRPSPTPFHPVEGFDYMGLAGVIQLRSLLGAAMSEQRDITSLRVDMLPFQYFNGKETKIDFLSKSIYKLRIIQLGVCVQDVEENSTSWENAKQTLSTNHFKSFLCLAPDLEIIEIQFDHKFCEPYIVNVANIFPTELVWPNLRKLKLSDIEIEAASFLDFLSFHNQTLRSMDLSNCDLVTKRPGPSSSVPSHGRWSNIFVPISTTLSLTTLSLSGLFFVSRFPDQESPHIRMSDSIRNVGLSIGETLPILVCSENFDTFLNCEMQGCKGLDVDMIKRSIIEDLMDQPLMRSQPPRDIEISTRYWNYIKEFKLFEGRQRSRRSVVEA